MSIKKLPDAEFEIMKAIWHSDEPITSSVLTEKLKFLLPEKDWKQQTVLTMLVRLEKFSGLGKAPYRNENLSQDELDELKEWINKM